MPEKPVRIKRFILSVLVAAVLGLGVLSGVPILSSLSGSHAPVAYADDCTDGPHPPPGIDCLDTPTSTPTNTPTSTPTEVDE